MKDEARFVLRGLCSRRQRHLPRLGLSLGLGLAERESPELQF